HPEDIPRCKALLASSIQTDQREESTEYRIRHINGTWRIHSSSAVVHKDKTGLTIYGIARDVTESKKAEEALKESEAFKDTLLNDSPNPIIVSAGVGGTIIYVNPSMEKLTGFSNSELVGHSPPYPWWDEDIRPYSRAEDRIDGVNIHERKCKNKKGEPFWLYVHIRTIEESGKIKYFIANCVDITERKKMEEALRESEAFKDSLLSQSPNPIFVFKPDDSIIYVNSSFETLTGYSSAELIGRKTPYPWWPEDKYEQYPREFMSLNQARVSYFERNYIKKNGETFWVALSIRPVIQNGKTTYYIANWVNITRRREMEDALRESESFNVSLLTEAPNPVLVFNPDQTIRYVNPALEKLTGFSKSQLIGTSPPHPWWPAEDFEKNMNEVIEDRKSQDSTFEKYFRRKNSEPFWVVISMRKIKENNKLKYILGNWVDITRQKTLEERISELYIKEKKQREELQEEAQARGLFINVLAHELRAPLTPIMASTGMLKDIVDQNDNEVQKKLAGNIYSSTEKLSKRLEDLLDLARYDRGTFRLNLQVNNMEKFLNEVIFRFEPGLADRKQHLTAEIAPDLPEGKFDPSRLEQVIINLLSNASKFSSEGSEIILKAFTEKNMLHVEVQDQGIGISPENQQRLFRAYHRVEQTSKQFPGLGLGLAVSKQIIEAHGGKIWVISQPGQGSTFSFTIPLNPLP
ncbi:MAG: PAS domain S-box protein, partial [Dehalococcoidales bacterium]|nr:PAS domain S-box protein [Dehalococcoidales bacterium]